jgi:hypothetical protein
MSHSFIHKECILTEAARQHQGFLKAPIAGIRPNILDIYRQWYDAEGGAILLTIVVNYRDVHFAAELHANSSQCRHLK